MRSSTTLLLAASGLAAATTIPVSVGKNGLTFEPNEIHASEGDVIEFRFWPKNHSVVAGDFAKPCRPAENNGFFSGFFPTQQGFNSQVFRVTVNHTNPIPIYCSQNVGQHCKNGMVAVINPAHGSSLTLDAYAAAARNAGNATSPQGGPFGGQVAPNEAASSSAGGGGSGSGSSQTASSTAVTTTVTSTVSSTVSSTATETQTQTEGTTTTGGGATGSSGGAATSTATNRPSGNTAAGIKVPVAGLLAVAVAAFFV